MRELRSAVTAEQYARVVQYVSQKPKYRNVSAFVRDAVFSAMERYPAKGSPGVESSQGGTAQGTVGQ